MEYSQNDLITKTIFFQLYLLTSCGSTALQTQQTHFRKFWLADIAMVLNIEMCIWILVLYFLALCLWYSTELDSLLSIKTQLGYYQLQDRQTPDNWVRNTSCMCSWSVPWKAILEPEANKKSVNLILSSFKMKFLTCLTLFLALLIMPWTCISHTIIIYLYMSPQIDRKLLVGQDNALLIFISMTLSSALAQSQFSTMCFRLECSSPRDPLPHFLCVSA